MSANCVRAAFTFLVLLALRVEAATRVQAAEAWAQLRRQWEGDDRPAKTRFPDLRIQLTKFTEQHSGTDEALAARLWLLERTVWRRNDPVFAGSGLELTQEILAEHPKSARLAVIVDCHLALPPGSKQTLFEELRAVTPHRSVKAAALFGMARFETDLESARSLYRELSRKYGKLPYRQTTYGVMAHAHTNIHSPSALENGRKAPEIQGFDVNGKPLRLSDFLGKVVVLRFWSYG